jgi:hypothetical protein
VNPKTLTLLKTESVGHSKKPKQSLGVEVLERFHPTMGISSTGKI